MHEDRIRTLINLATKKAGMTREGVSRKPLIIICQPSGDWHIIEGALSPLSLPADVRDKPVSLEDALEAFILKR